MVVASDPQARHASATKATPTDRKTLEALGI
jgi:hypothetical protein